MTVELTREGTSLQGTELTLIALGFFLLIPAAASGARLALSGRRQSGMLLLGLAIGPLGATGVAFLCGAVTTYFRRELAQAGVDASGQWAIVVMGASIGLALGIFAACRVARWLKAVPDTNQKDLETDYRDARP